MTLGILVVAFERAALTRRCLDSIRACARVPYHVYLVDNGSKSLEAGSLLQDLVSDAQVTVLNEAVNLGPSAARNRALAILPESIDVVAMLDNDIVVLPGWDEAALQAVRDGADLAQPKLLLPDRLTIERGPNEDNDSPLAINPRFIGRGISSKDSLVNQARPVSIVGGTGIVRRSVFDQLGFFDGRLHVGEDFDLSLRARQAGKQLRYAPACELIHDHPLDLGYDQVRSRTDKYLTAHIILWNRWRKALLSPCYLHWYAWLHFKEEPMYLPESQRWSIVHRRLRRRLARAWIMRKYGNHWVGEDEAADATDRLALRLGGGF